MNRNEVSTSVIPIANAQEFEQVMDKAVRLGFRPLSSFADKITRNPAKYATGFCVRFTDNGEKPKFDSAEVYRSTCPGFTFRTIQDFLEIDESSVSVNIASADGTEERTEIEFPDIQDGWERVAGQVYGNTVFVTYKKTIAPAPAQEQ